MESLPNYDYWKLQAPDIEDIPHPNSYVNDVGRYISFTFNENLISGLVIEADNEFVTLLINGVSCKFDLDNIKHEENI